MMLNAKINESQMYLVAGMFLNEISEIGLGYLCLKDDNDNYMIKEL